MSGVYLCFSYMSLWRGQGKLYLLLQANVTIDTCPNVWDLSSGALYRLLVMLHHGHRRCVRKSMSDLVYVYV